LRELGDVAAFRHAMIKKSKGGLCRGDLRSENYTQQKQTQSKKNKHRPNDKKRIEILFKTNENTLPTIKNNNKRL
jgi:hypothetical protein